MLSEYHHASEAADSPKKKQSKWKPYVRALVVHTGCVNLAHLVRLRSSLQAYLQWHRDHKKNSRVARRNGIFGRLDIDTDTGLWRNKVCGRISRYICPEMSRNSTATTIIIKVRCRINKWTSISKMRKKIESFSIALVISFRVQCALTTCASVDLGTTYLAEAKQFLRPKWIVAT